jgi:hypothetical protein
MNSMNEFNELIRKTLDSYELVLFHAMNNSNGYELVFLPIIIFFITY